MSTSTRADGLSGSGGEAGHVRPLATGEWIGQPLLSTAGQGASRSARLLLLSAWLVVTVWLSFNHVPWRDEVRAWSLMQMGESWAGMFRAVHGEGHPYLWYMLLRTGHALFGVREVLPALGLLVGVAAAGLLALKAPFRLGVLAAAMFSLHLGFDYSVVSRNYGLTALVLFVIAATYRRLRDSPAFGVLLLLLCNTNAPSVFLAGALFLYRMIEVALTRPPLRSRATAMLGVNGLLLLAGTLLCFLAIYPPVNDGAAAASRTPLTAANALLSLFDAERSFGALGFDNALFATNIFMFLAVAVFIRSKPALIAAVAAFLTMKLFFFFAFPAAYRHAALFLLFLLTLLWIEAAREGRGDVTLKPVGNRLPLIPSWALAMLLAMQSILYVKEPVVAALRGEPYSNAANLAAILQQPEYRGSVPIFDPDALGEAVVYHTGRPFWLMRQGRLGTIASFAKSSRSELTLDDFLDTAARLHAETGQPALLVFKQDLATVQPGRYPVMYTDHTTLTRDGIQRFLRQTRKIASLRRTSGDEEYDVFRYPR